VATVDAAGLVTVVGAGTARISATVDNGIGTNVVGNSDLEAATVLANGVTVTVPNVAEEEFIDYAFVSNGTLASFSVVTAAGSSGDSDMHIFAPGIVPAFNASSFTYTNFVCRPWDVGSDETCNVTSPVAGTYRIRFYVYPDGGNLAGMTATLTHP
jgi:microbial collagenase